MTSYLRSQVGATAAEIALIMVIIGVAVAGASVALRNSIGVAISGAGEMVASVDSGTTTPGGSTTTSGSTTPSGSGGSTTTGGSNGPCKNNGAGGGSDKKC